MTNNETKLGLDRDLCFLQQNDETHPKTDPWSHLVREIVFDKPNRMVGSSAWIGHIPFAFWLIEALKPLRFIELGTHSGVSYSAFAQAVKKLKLPTQCYAVDTWQGDEQAGFYDGTVFEEFSTYHDAHYLSFSRLLCCTFDDAATFFEDASIDLLHIDGLHTYEAVKHDFEVWSSKLSDRGIVLFHDVNVRKDGYSVRHLWEELIQLHPSFRFDHSYGLGVIAVGKNIPPPLCWLFSLTSASDSQAASWVRQFFETIGGALSDQLRAQQVEDTVLALRDQQAELVQKLDAVQSEIVSLREDTPRLTTDCRSTTTSDRIEPLEREIARVRENCRLLGTEVPDEQIVRDFEVLFDSAWYSREHPDVGTDEKKALLHYLSIGWKEAYDPSPLFSTRYYLATNPDVRDFNPLVHFVIRGACEGRNPHPLFDLGFYCRQIKVDRDTNPLAHFVTQGHVHGVSPHPLFNLRAYQGVELPAALHNNNPLQHYLEIGHQQQPKLHPLFDAGYYASIYPDVRDTPPLLHYVTTGVARGWQPHPLFDPHFYGAQSAAAGEKVSGNPLIHYLERARSLGCDPHPLFSSNYYLRNMSVRDSQVPALLHYATSDPLRRHSPHPLFDPEYYEAQVKAAGQTMTGDPLVHYLRHGLELRCNPHPLFDAKYYVESNPEVASLGVLPLLHYVTTGAAQGRQPHPLFDPYYYGTQTGAVGERVTGNPLIHYLENGARLSCDPHPLFNTRYYLDRADAPGGAPALLHYVLYGSLNRQSPHPLFDCNYYEAQVGPNEPIDGDPLAHYICHGLRLRASSHPLFDAKSYLDANPDAVRSCMNPLVHHLMSLSRSQPQNFNAAIDFAADADAAAPDIDRPGYFASTTGGIPAYSTLAVPKIAAPGVNFVQDARPVVLLVMQKRGGDIEKHVHSLIERFSDKVHYLVLRVDASSTFILSSGSENDPFETTPVPRGPEQLSELMRSLHVQRIHVHDFLGYESEVHHFLLRAGVPYDLTIHNYALICPRTYLFSPLMNYCQEPDTLSCLRCLQTDPPALATDILWWRWKGRELILGADRVICPSHDVAIRISRYAPGASLILAPHDDPAEFLARPNHVPVLGSNDPLRVLVLGTLDEPIEDSFLLKCACACNRVRMEVEFVIHGSFPLRGEIGDTATQTFYRLRHTNSSDEIADLITETKPHLILYPPQWPETYGYALNEGLLAGAPLLVPDVGAYSERVRGQQWCWVYDSSSTPEALAKTILSIRRDHIGPRRPPAPAVDAGSNNSSGDDWFYNTRFLIWTADNIDVPKPIY